MQKYFAIKQRTLLSEFGAMDQSRGARLPERSSGATEDSGPD
jgi:hypothetical protein